VNAVADSKYEQLDIGDAEEAKAAEPCTFCGQDQCDWDMFGDKIT
jgi:hypothetical protein